MGIFDWIETLVCGDKEIDMPRKRVYIAHPLVGDMDRRRFDPDVIAERIVDVSLICREISAKEPDVLVVSPIHMFGFYHPSERAKPLADCEQVVKHLVDEVWVFGEWEKSEGCLMEIDWAREAGVPVLYKAGEYGSKTFGEEVMS